VPDDGTCGLKQVALIDDIIKVLCLTLIYTPISTHFFWFLSSCSFSIAHYSVQNTEFQKLNPLLFSHGLV